MRAFVNSDATRRMFESGLESMLYRQSLSETGGIVESDDRVDRGNYLYKDRCWLRNYHIEPLLAAEMNDAALRNIRYWLTALEKSGDGFFRHNYHFSTAEKGKAHHCQIDNNAHFIFHVWHAFQSLGAGSWFAEAWPAVASCANYLISRFDESYNMLRGIEERVVESVTFPECYSFYINRVCAKALELAGEMAGQEGLPCDAATWRKTAARVREGIRRNLYDETRGCYAYLRFVPDADHPKAGKLSHDESWGTLWPYISDDEYDERDWTSIRSRLDALLGTDPLIPDVIACKDPVMIARLKETDPDNPAFLYSGVGVTPAANAVAAYIMSSHQNDDEGAARLWKGMERLSGDRDLLPEHVNTMHPGRMKDYAIWPDEKSLVDSGNLMHLTMFMTMALRLGFEL